MEFSVIALADKIQTEADAYAFLEDLRWNGTPICPHCHSTERIYFLNPENGVSRKTRTGAASQRRVWKCGACRKQFSVTTGTIFHGSKISLRKWLFVVYEMCANKNGVAAREIERRYDLTAKSAWFMLHRIREAMKQEPLAGMLSGTIVADETYIGGKFKNKSKGRRAAENAPRPVVPGEASGPWPSIGKTTVLSLINTDTGEVRSRVVPDVTGPTLRKALAEQVDLASSVLHTDTWRGYLPVGAEMAGHKTVNHSDDEYARYEDGVMVTTNHAEGFFSQLKRSIDGTHHHVSVEHLPRYLAEFDFRYSTRKLSDSARTRALVDRVAGRRLTYRPLTEG